MALDLEKLEKNLDEALKRDFPKQERELKFRAWDKKNKKFAFVGFNMIGEMMLFDALNQYQLIELVKLEVTQFSGSKDVNGKDIYEGDIVKRITDDERTEISFIEFVAHGFWVHDESFGWEGESLWHWKDIEVIGNVYENMELIKDEWQLN